MTSSVYLNPLILIPFVILLTVINKLIPQKYRWILLLIISYGFYFLLAKWSILLLIISTLFNYGLSHVLYTRKGKNKLPLIAGISLNVLILVFFKCFAQLISPNAPFFSLLNSTEGKIIFPVGLSFYTLQNISYLVDTSKGLLAPEKNLGIFAVYVAFFPKILAGPIERGKKLLPQLAAPENITSEDIHTGTRLILFGLFKKLVIADRLLVFVNELFTHPGEYQGAILLAGIFFLSFQIYLDFSGYTNIALGIAKLLGINLTENFNRPYFSNNIVEFWNRWHISFSSWLRDYIFYPTRRFFLKKTGKSLGFFSLVVPPVLAMLLSGLWHGSGWTFVVWGMYHAFFYTLVILRKNKSMQSEQKPRLVIQIINILVNFIVLSIGWVFFKADSINTALIIFKNIFVRKIDLMMLLDNTSHFDFILALILLTAVITFECYAEVHPKTYEFKKLPYLIRWSIYLVMVLCISLFGIFQSGGNPFIYGLF